jgi:hypothetical protein
MNDKLVKKTKTAANKFKKEFKQAFQSDWSQIEVEAINDIQVMVHMDINCFISDGERKQFDMVCNDLQEFLENYASPLKIIDNSYFGGGIAASLIKRGQVIEADSLLSYVEFILVFPNTSKKYYF